MAKTKIIEAPSKEAAQQKLAEQLGIAAADLRHVLTESRKHTFEVLKCPPQVLVEISRDGMRAYLKRLSPPLGEGYPTFNMQFILEEFKKAGVVHGIKRDILSQELMKAIKGAADSSLNILVAEGTPAVNGSVSRPKYNFDIKIFEKPDPIYVKAGEALAISPEAAPPKDGMKVTGDTIEATLEETHKLQVGVGIKAKRVKNELHYMVEASGRLYYDQGIRLRVDPKVLTADEGMTVSVEINKNSLFGAPFKAADLIQWVTSQGVVFGMNSENTIAQQIAAVKKWPARIIMAKGLLPVDGKAGPVKELLKETASKAIDQEKNKAGIVFPGEAILILKPPTEPVNGHTPMGEILRAKPYTDFAVYPGKNVVREKQGDDIVLKSQIYGVAKRDGDRLHVESPLKIAADKMSATMDLYPQQKLTLADIAPLLRESDILVSPPKEAVEKRLLEAFEKALPVKDFLVVEGRPPQAGRDAKLIYRFDPNLFKEKGLFQKKEVVTLLAAKNDLLLTKMEPMEAQPGYNVFREKIPVPESGIPKDIQIESGDNVDEKRLGRDDDPNDPPKTEYRAGRYGILKWASFKIDIEPAISVDKEEKLAMISLAPATDFGTRITVPLLKETANDEGIRVDLSLKILEAALLQPRAPDKSLKKYILAEALPVVHGKNSSIQYLVEYNNENIEKFLNVKTTPNPLAADCVRPGDILAIKTPATLGTDGKSVFGKRLPADRGRDEPWFPGFGVEKSADGMQLVCALKGPGFVTIDNGRISVQSTVRLSNENMKATISLYPTKNPRFPLREDKILAMLDAAGVKFGIKRELIRALVQQVNEGLEPVIDAVVAEGSPAKSGSDAAYVFAVDVGQTVGELRDDGSIDFRNKHVFQNVVKGAVILIRRPPTTGELGKNVMGLPVPAKPGADLKIEAGEGIDVLGNGMEYRARYDGIVEYKDKKIRVFPGLMLSDDVGFKTGHINAGAANVFIKGNILPDFTVRSEGKITVEKAAEACIVEGKQEVVIRGGIIGKDRGKVFAGGNLETMYISGGATVDCAADIKVGTEVLNSFVRAAGRIDCLEGAGTISGGEIWAFKGMKVKSLGTYGAESPTMIHLGEHYFAIQEAKKKIKEAKIEEQIADVQKQIQDLQKDLSLILSEREDLKIEAQDLQERYQQGRDQKKELEIKLMSLEEEKAAIESLIPWNDTALLIVQDIMHPGVTVQFKNVVWTLKGELRGVEVFWDSRTSNLISRKISGSK